MMTSRQVIDIKASRQGIVLVLDEGTPFSEIREAIVERFEEARGFFSSASIKVHLGNRALRKGEIRALEELLCDRFGLELSALLCSAAALLEYISVDLGFEVALADEPRTVERAAENEETLLLKRTCRSGTDIYFPGNIVILGDVNSGAQVSADGNITVFGALRGVAHAGAAGDNSAIIVALALNPTHLRIGDHLALPPDAMPSKQSTPEIAYVKDGTIIVEAYRGRMPKIE